MSVITTVAWDTLTADEQRTLITSHPTVDAQCLVLNFDLSVADDVSAFLDPSSGSVKWESPFAVNNEGSTGSQPPRDCQFNLSTLLPWGQVFIQLSQTLTDPVSDLSAIRSLGVFCPTAPSGDISETPVTRPVTGQDRTYLLDRRAAYDVTFTSGALITDSIVSLLVQAGLHDVAGNVIGLLIDPAVTGATVTRDLLFPQLGGSSMPSVTMADQTVLDYSAPATWRTMLNTLLAMVATPMRAVWADEVGRYRCDPYRDPATATPSYTFNSDDPSTTVGMSRTPTHDLWQAYNAWTFVQANPVGDPIIVPIVNSSDGDSSIGARNNLWYPAPPITVDAVSHDELAAKGFAIAAQQQRAPWTAAVTTGPFPAAGHCDVFAWLDKGLDATWKAAALSWEIGLDGADVVWQWNRIG